ncbi:MAG: amidohydrolase [Planctomycetota bacterium]|jgi:amidohydrolase
MKRLIWMSFAALILGVTNLEAQAGFRDEIAADYEANLRELFIHFHLNPELSSLEVKTAARLAAELRALGVEVTEGVGGTGIVGMLKNGEGPLVLVRADMDGLPVKENSGAEHQSEVMQVNTKGDEVPVMHACGHDVHMTSLVGTARQLQARRDRWSGTVMFVGQPAEETISGARAMIQDNLYARFGVPDFALAFHVGAGDPAGKVEVKGGPVYSSSDSVDIIVHGIGAHGASPHKGKDPIYIASQIVIALQGIVSRELSPLRPGVVTVGAFHSGSKHNIISDEAHLQLTVRSNDTETRDLLLSAIERIALGVARTNGLPEDLLPDVIFSKVETTPPTVNDIPLADRIGKAFLRELGPEWLHASNYEGMGAEDFAYFVNTEERVPGCYFGVGGTLQSDLDAEAAGGRAVASHHSPFFRIAPKPSIISGVQAMTVAVEELLGKR